MGVKVYNLVSNSRKGGRAGGVGRAFFWPLPVAKQVANARRRAAASSYVYTYQGRSMVMSKTSLVCRQTLTPLLPSDIMHYTEFGGHKARRFLSTLPPRLPLLANSMLRWV